MTFNAPLYNEATFDAADVVSSSGIPYTLSQGAALHVTRVAPLHLTPTTPMHKD